MFILNNNPLPLDTAFTTNDIQYPANWLRFASAEEKLAIGVTEVADPAQIDDRFYWMNSDGTGVPKDLDKLKVEWLKKIDDMTYSTLLSSDWMVVRKAETGTDIPTEWADYRTAVRSNNTTNKILINGATDFEQFVSIATSLVWVDQPNQPQLNISNNSAFPHV
jgi:hypothetical protein